MKRVLIRNKKNNIKRSFAGLFILLLNEMTLSALERLRYTTPQHRPTISEKTIFIGLSEIK